MPSDHALPDDLLWLQHLVVVLYRPRDPVNIGGVVRALLNMGVARLRLVDPIAYDRATLLTVAHRSDALVDAMAVYDTLPAALADAVYVVGTTDHMQGHHPITTDVTPVADSVRQHAATGTVALLFGSENNGLDDAAMAQCHMLVRLPTDPAYPSLNLAQAVLLLLYELRRSSTAGVPPPPAAPPATQQQLNTLAEQWAGVLKRGAFCPSARLPTVLRRLRHVVYRARLSTREAELLTAIARHLQRNQQA